MSSMISQTSCKIGTTMKYEIFTCVQDRSVCLSSYVFSISRHGDTNRLYSENA